MNNLSPRIREILRAAGFVWHRTGKGDHEIWRHLETGAKVAVDAKVKSRTTANRIMKQAGLPKAF
jgi:predicted RNA binding protein YcfA (HicA-like mRNA interferase family)